MTFPRQSWGVVRKCTFSSAFSVNDGTGAAKGQVKFEDPILSNHLIDKFKDFGAVSEQITTFQQTDKLVLLSSVKNAGILRRG